MKEISNPLSVEVYNSVGQVVSSSLVVSNKTILALGHLSNGVYYYQLETSNAVLATGKLVKLH
jgi:hypothetical protein